VTIEACACRTPPAPTSLRKQATGSRVAASKNTVWPLATNARTAWLWSGLNTSMCGRVGLAPVSLSQSAVVAPARSTTSGATASPRRSAAPSRISISPP
jgi:hypothetical protein